jgi:hypothetical protein
VKAHSFENKYCLSVAVGMRQKKEVNYLSFFLRTLETAVVTEYRKRGCWVYYLDYCQNKER